MSSATFQLLMAPRVLPLIVRVTKQAEGLLDQPVVFLGDQFAVADQVVGPAGGLPVLAFAHERVAAADQGGGKAVFFA